MRWLWTGLLMATMACSGGEVETPAPEPAKEAVEKAPEKPEPPKEPAQAPLPEDAHPAMLDPSQANKTAPDLYKVKVHTSEGDFVVEVHRDWAPLGADRFYNLVDIGYYSDTRFFRAIDGFMVQWGISGYPEVNKAWRDAKIDDDEGKQSNTRGMVTFATSGKDTRTTQLFINFKDNSNLDPMGFTPFGKVVEGMDVVDKLYKGYGEGAPRGRGPNQARIQQRGNAYLDHDFPKLSKIESMAFVD
jgi:peptidyl-prolyl cis-trans isomerase A (cyclophilin A)